MTQTARNFRFVDTEGRDITGTEQVQGYFIRDFFDCDITIARSDDELTKSYKGPDSDGIGVQWDANA
jgi:hypothetical protein